MTLTRPIPPTSLAEPDQELARQASQSLAPIIDFNAARVTLRVVDPRSGEEVEVTLPAGAMRILGEATARMAAGDDVTIVSEARELSTQQAADLVGVSRPYFVKLLEQGRIPFRKVGNQRRVRYRDLLRYNQTHRQEAIAAASELTAEAQKLGL